MKRSKKCFGLLLALPIMFGLSLSVSLNANAESISYTAFGVYNSDWYRGCANWSYLGDLSWNEAFSACAIRSFIADSTNVQSTGQYWSITGKFNVVRRRIFQYQTGVDMHKFVNLHVMNVLRASHNGNALTITSSSVQTYITQWQISDTEKYETLTIQYTASGQGAVNGNGKIRVVIGSDVYAFLWPTNENNPTNDIVYFEEAGQSPTVNFAGSFDDGSSQTMINQNNTIINQNDQMINQNQTIINQDNQDRSDIQNQQNNADDSADGSQTQAESTGTTLLGAFTSFVNAITSASPSNCNIDMDLGNLDLGVVDFCTLSPPAPIPTIASIFMILFCVPLSIATARKLISLFRSFQ